MELAPSPLGAELLERMRSFVAPSVATGVIDQVIQVHGAGSSDDTPLARRELARHRERHGG